MRYLLCLIAIMCMVAVVPASAFDIASYDTVMQVSKDSSVTVTETIVADFRGDPHHGIYRDIPLSGKDKYGNNYRIRHKMLGVTDAGGSSLQTQITSNGGRVNIRIGDPNTMVEGIQTYVIRYRLLRAVHFFPEGDELYWNVVGREWTVVIRKATATVELPPSTPPHSIRTTGYTGAYGQTSAHPVSSVPNNHTARFSMKQPLNPGEAMTIVVGWPKGVVAQPKRWQEALWFISDNGYFFLPPIFLLGLVLLWYRAGRDPDTGRSEMVAFDPPDGMTPAEIGTLIDEQVDMRDITATIIDLAVRGLILIKSDKEKGLLFSRTEYTLELTRSYDEMGNDTNLSGYEIALISAIFGGNQFRVMSDLATKFYVHLPKLRNQLYESLVKRGYFTHRPDRVRKSYQNGGIAMIVTGIFASLALLAPDIPAAFAISVGWGLALSVCGVMLVIAAGVMPRKTTKGKDALLAIKGFEEYISRAERAEIEHQERNDYFEKFLPYAIALGIADRWAKAFEGIQTQPPQWYSGYDGAFRPTFFVHNLSTASSDWGRTMAAQPRSSGSSGGSSFYGGGSGFSGGSSGGGGGGGGGGGW